MGVSDNDQRGGLTAYNRKVAGSVRFAHFTEARRVLRAAPATPGRYQTLSWEQRISKGSPQEACPNMTDQEKAEVVARVSAAVAGYGEAIKKMDLEAAGEFWADDPGFVIAGDGALVASYDEWMSQIKELWDGTAEVNSVELFNPHVYVLAEDAAAYSTEYKWSITSNEGETTNARGSWTYVFKHLNGLWRVVHSAGAHLFD